MSGSLTRGGGEIVPGIPGFPVFPAQAQPAILRIWLDVQAHCKKFTETASEYISVQEFKWRTVSGCD